VNRDPVNPSKDEVRDPKPRRGVRVDRGSARARFDPTPIRRTLTAKVPVTPTLTQPLNSPAWNGLRLGRLGSEHDDARGGRQRPGRNPGAGGRLDSTRPPPPSATFQGALYGTNAVDIDTTSQAIGPIVGSTVYLGQSTATSFPSVTVAPAGMPGSPMVYAQPNPPQLYGG
jgi:hypothetical protein